MACLMVTTLEHEKSFLMQESASSVWSMALYGDSLLLTVSSDIVQKDIQTGAIQRTFRAHKKQIRSFVLTKDSRLISSAFDDMIIVWSLETGSILKRIWLRSSGTNIQSLSYQYDRVFTGGLDSKVRQVDLESGIVVRTTSVIGKILCVTAAADSLYVGKDRPNFGLKLNIESGAILQSLNGHSDAISSLFVSDNQLISGSYDTTIICWNILNGDMIRTFFGHSGGVQSVAIFDGELYSSAYVREIFKWNINDGLVTRKFKVVHEGSILSLAYKSQALFTGSSDVTVIKWNASSGEVSTRYTGRNSKLNCVVYLRNFIISGGEDAQIQMWAASTGDLEPFAFFDNNYATILSMFVLEDEFFYGDYYGDIKQINLTSFTLENTLNVLGDVALSITANKWSLYVGGALGYIYELEKSSGIEMAFFNAHSAQISSLQLTDDVLYSGSFDTIVRAWDSKYLEIVGDYTASDPIYAILIKQDNLIACTAASVETFSAFSGEQNIFVQENSACLCMVTHENTVYTGHEDSLIKVRSLYSLAPYETYTGHFDSVLSLCFDEIFNLYSAGNDGSIKKWNMASRRVAFSFEIRNGSVSSLAVDQSQLFVGLRSGRIDCYKIDKAVSFKSRRYHSQTVSYLIVFNGSIYSSGFDGTVLKFPSKGEENFTLVYKSDLEPIKDLSVGSSFWIALQGDAKIVLSPTNLNSTSLSVIEFHAPFACIEASESFVFAGSKLGIIYAWNFETLQLAFELKGHVSPVNDLLVADDSLFSASDDKTVIEWSLESKTTRKTYKRLSASALGHLGPVNSLSYCSDTLFSAGADLTVRRWNTITGKHDDVYFGFTKSVTTVLCYNGSVFAGSEDFSVLMFKPSLPQNQDLIVKRTTKNSNRKKIVRLQRALISFTNPNQILVPSVVASVVIILLVIGFILYSRRQKKVISQSETTASKQETLSSQTITDLQTVVNSVIGISRHAAYRLENSALTKLSKIAEGGGGELFRAKVTDESLRKKHGEIVVQKVVFTKNKMSEEAFYQEVGIMILLSSFPHFCIIIGFTENPFSMILKNYQHGSLNDWLGKNNYGTKVVIKILKETASALNIMHSHYLAHCDLKPQNILVELENGLPSCYLTDFGITQILSEKIIATKAFHVINLRGLSIHYAAPEAFKNFRTKKYVGVDFKAYDTYSFACVTLEVFNRKMPWI